MGFSLSTAIHRSQGAAAQPPLSSAAMEGVTDHARDLLATKDTAAVVEYIVDNADPVEALGLIRSLANEAYWEVKNLNQAMALARAGVFAGIALSAHSDRPYELRSEAKSLAFNLASYAWPGWDEAGIVIEHQHLLEALDAARTNVRLAVELEKGSVAIGRGHWMVGAVLLALGRYQDAIAEFLAARLSADEGRSDVESALAEGYAALVRVVERPGDAAMEVELTEILDRLRGFEDGDTYARQIETALRVFAT